VLLHIRLASRRVDASSTAPPFLIDVRYERVSTAALHNDRLTSYLHTVNQKCITRQTADSPCVASRPWTSISASSKLTSERMSVVMPFWQDRLRRKMTHLAASASRWLFLASVRLGSCGPIVGICGRRGLPRCFLRRGSFRLSHTPRGRWHRFPSRRQWFH
jgi:hypothetical protein